MNTIQKETDRKHIEILSGELCRWEGMTKDALMCELIKLKLRSLETETNRG